MTFWGYNSSSRCKIEHTFKSVSNFQCHFSSNLYMKQNFQVLKSNVNFVVPLWGTGRKSGGTFMGVDWRVDRGHFLYFWSGGDALCFVPLLFRGWHFCTNAHGILWMIRAIFVKFSQLILRTVTKIVAIRFRF